MLLRHLAEAERHVIEGERHLALQRAMIEELGQDGHQTGAARALLREMEELQALHVADLQRIRAELEGSE